MNGFSVDPQDYCGWKSESFSKPHRPLATADQNAAIFTAITRCLAGSMGQFFEVAMFGAAAIEALGTMAIAQFFGRHSEMTASATHGDFAFNKQF